MQPPGRSPASSPTQPIPLRRSGETPAGARSPAASRAPAAAATRYEDFLRSTVDWLWETDAELTFTYVSSPVALKLGIPAQVLVGRPLLGLGRFEPVGGREAQAEAAIAARRPFRGARYAMTGREQRSVTYRLSGVPHFDAASDRFAGYRGTAVAAAETPPAADDAGAELQALASTLEEALLRQQELAWRLAQVQATPAAGRELPLARTAHELRTPLNAIIGYADLALSEVFGPLGERYAESLRTIREAGRHLDRLVGQMQEAAKTPGAQALASEAIDIAALVAETKAIVALAAQEGEVDLSRVGPLAGGCVLGDRIACTQILVNLLNNAVKYTRPGGSVGLETLVGPDQRLQIVVWDTGIGIAPEEQAQIFEPSYRARPPEGVPQAAGLGLGLAISRELARRMGGDITVSSQPGQGSRFILSLPLAAEPTPSTAPPAG